MMYDYVEVETPQGDLAMYGGQEGDVVHKVDDGVRVVSENSIRFFPMSNVFSLYKEGDEE